MLIKSIIIIINAFVLATSAQPLSLQHQRIAGQIIKTALVEQQGYNWLAELCTLGPRLSGYPTSYDAINWCQQKLTEIGCDRIWLQSMMAPYWKRGDFEKAIMHSAVEEELAIAALGKSIGTPEQGITAAVLEVRSFEELKDKAKQAKGKIIFFNRPFDQAVTHTFDGYGAAVNQRIQGAIEASRVGAVAALVRSVTSKNDNVPHTGVMRYQQDVPKIPAAAIAIMDADKLSKTLRQNPQTKVTLQLACKNLSEVETFNVIGEIRGSAFPDQVILVGGHLDAWDKGDGAHDDGAGCMQAMEVLSLIKKCQIIPKRTIRCVLFFDEEQNQSGAKVYADYAKYAHEQHVAAIESDRGAFTPRGFSVTADSLIIEHMRQWLPILQPASIDWIRPGGSGADIGRIKNATALIGYVPDSQRYFDLHHSANDVFAEIHPREFELGSAAITILTYLISEQGL